MCEHASGSTGDDRENKFRICTVAYNNYELTYVTITEKLSVATDKGHKPGHFWKIKKIPQDTIQGPEKRPRIATPSIK